VNWLLLKNSLLVGSLTMLLATAFGVIGAIWSASLPRPWRSLVLGAAMIALALPPFLVTNSWLHFLGQTGAWRDWLPMNVTSVGGTIWILSLGLWPIPMLATLSAWRRLEPAQLESDTAVTGFLLLRHLLLPLARPALVQAAVIIFVLALNNFAVPAIMQVKVFPEEMWVRFNTSFDTAGTLALSWPLIAGPLLLLFWLARREVAWPHLQPTVSARLFREQLGRAWFWASGVSTLLLGALSVGLPLVQIVSARRTWTELPGAVAAGHAAIWNSIWLALASASGVIALGLAFALPRTGKGQRIAGVVGWAAWLSFLLPGVLLGIAIIAAINRPWSALFYQSSGIVILAFILRYLALGWNAVNRSSQMVDRDLLDVARLEGATRWQILRHVHWPQIGSQVLAAWYIIFLLSLWDVESMILIVPPGGETLALRIFNLLHYGHNAQVNALCLMLLFLAVVPLALWKLWVVARERVLIGSRRAPVTPAAVLGAVLLVQGCTPAGSADRRVHSELFGDVRVIGSRGVGIGQLNKPRSVAVDAQDNLYVVDMTGRVQKFSPAGQFLLSWQMPQTDRGKPKGMCRDRQGNVVVIEPHYSRVNHYSTGGKLLVQWGEHGTNSGQLSVPRAVAVDSRNEIFVSEYQEAERVQKFKGDDLTLTGPAHASPTLLTSFGRAGTAPGEFNRPEGLCVDGQDRLYVADSCNHRIQVFSADGKLLRTYGKPGRGKGELSYPYDICVDAEGRQYVCEFGNSRIQVFDAQDRPLEIFGGPGAEPGKFSNPWSVALDSAGNLYVADSQNHRVQKLMRKQDSLRMAGNWRPE
jgi:ABC-type Fe3+ transport system permease subunit/DNA-binding beta-propeller fold protein YncE